MKILDGRYQIQKILSETNGVICYEAIQKNIGIQVLIQEHSGEEAVQKKVLEKARAFGDFTELRSIFHVNDYFCEDGHSFIVLEYPVGETLKECVQKNGCFEEEQLIEKMIPFLRDLQYMETAKMTELEISWENLYLKKDGTFCLMPDFRKDLSYGKSLTYQICEILYNCLTAQQMPEWELRLLFDESESIEAYNSNVDTYISKLIQDGLCLDTEQKKIPISELEMSFSEWISKKKKAKKSGRRNKILMFSSGLILTVVLLIGIWQRYKEQLIFLGTETEMILLIADETMTQTDYNQAVHVIKNRVRHLTSKYMINVKDGRISIKIPLDVYKSVSKDENVIKQYLSAPLKIDVIKSEDYSFFKMLQDSQYVTLEPEDIESVDTMELENMSQSISQQDVSIDKLLVLYLTDKASEKLKEKFDDRKSIFGCFDADQNSYSERIEVGAITDDWKKVGIQKNEYFQLAEPVLMDETFHTAFHVSTEIKENWVNPEGELGESYAHWIMDGKVEEPCATMEYYDLPEGWQKNQGDYVRTLSGLAERLEVIEVPYSIGISGENNENIVVKMQQKNVTQTLGKILGERKQWNVKTYWGEQLVAGSDMEADVSNENEKTFIKLRFTSTKEENVQEFLDEARGADGYVYLMFGDYQIARVRYDELYHSEIDGGKYGKNYGITYEWKFQETDFGESGIVTEQMRPFIQLLQKINENKDLQNTMRLKQIQYSDKGEIVAVMKEKNPAWERSEEELNTLRKIAAETDGYAEIVEENYGYYYGTEELQIMLHMDLEEDYCETAYSRITELWKNGNMDGNPYSCVKFFVGEKEQYPEVVATKGGSEKTWKFEVYYDDTYGEKFAKLFE